MCVSSLKIELTDRSKPLFLTNAVANIYFKIKTLFKITIVQVYYVESRDKVVGINPKSSLYCSKFYQDIYREDLEYEKV